MEDDLTKPSTDEMIAGLTQAGYDVEDLRGLTAEERQEIIKKVVDRMNAPVGFEIEDPEDDPHQPYVERVKQSSHELEKFFDIEEGTTLIPYKERTPTELKQCSSYDEKDTEIESQLQEIFDAAMEAYENSLDEAEDIEPKYKARAREVSVNFLNTALDAIKTKSKFKTDKDKVERASKAAESGGKTTNNFFMDRNELLKMMRAEKEAAERALDGDFQEIDEEG